MRIHRKSTRQTIHRAEAEWSKVQGEKHERSKNTRGECWNACYKETKTNWWQNRGRTLSIDTTWLRSFQQKGRLHTENVSNVLFNLIKPDFWMNTTKPKPLLIGSQTGRKRELTLLTSGVACSHKKWEGLNKTDEYHVAGEFSLVLEADFYLFICLIQCYSSGFVCLYHGRINIIQRRTERYF